MATAKEKNDPRVDLLIRFLDQAFDKKAWHGPTLRGSLRGVKLEEALWRPSPKHHNIRDLAIHCAYWKYVVRRKLSGEKRGSFAIEGSNWFRAEGAPTAASWKADIALLDKEHKLLRETIASLPYSELTRLDMIMGAASHDLYHAGQIQLLKRLIRGGTANS
jgi:hypothetical protein